MCRHILIDGLGMYSDALTCIKCGESFYPEFNWTKKALSRVLKSEEYPWLLDAAKAAMKAKSVREESK